MSGQHAMATRPPLHEVAHLGHIELLTPEPDASLRFFADILGLTETGREGNSVYLRTWDDYEHHTVKLTAAVAEEPGSGLPGARRLRAAPGPRQLPRPRDVPPNGEFVRDVLGGRVTEQIMLDDGTISAQWLHFTNKGYDLVYTRDWTGTAGRLHHVAFAPDTREDILRAADICLDRGVFIETGPHKHAIQQTFFLYVYEPGGNRIELCNPVARLVLAQNPSPIYRGNQEKLSRTDSGKRLPNPGLAQPRVRPAGFLPRLRGTRPRRATS